MANVSNKQKEKFINDFESQLSKLYNSLVQLDNDITILQDGEDENPYWNGINAYDNLNSLLKIVKSNKLIYNNLQTCKEKIEK